MRIVDCGVWSAWKMKNVEKCRVWKIRSMENKKCGK